MLHSNTMPTSRKRHTLTESDELARALDDAAAHWPEDRRSRTRLLLRLVEAGHGAISAADDERAAMRREAAERTSGALSGVYGPGYLERLRGEWPE